MKKIDFRDKKVILPLIFLPFLFIGYYFYTSYFKEEPQEIATVTNGINIDVPEPILKEDQQKNKLDAFKEVEIQNGGKDKSFIVDVGEEKIPNLIVEDNLNSEQIQKLDSLQKIINGKRESSARNTISLQTQDYIAQKLPAHSSTKKRTSKRPKNPKRKKREPLKKDNELESFKQQVRIMDSIQNPEKYALPTKIEEEKKQTTSKISKTRPNQNDYFNTIKTNKEETFITAVLDQGIKAYQGSRVRFRLLQDIFINDILFKKGKHLFGTVTGFKSQRVEVTINSIAYSDRVIPVNIIIYDNDGIQGLYVPDSQFREFAKDLGLNVTNDVSRAGQGNSNINSNPGSQALYQSITSAVQSSSRAVAKALRKNKARLKYNTQVYLINSENNEE